MALTRTKKVFAEAVFAGKTNKEAAIAAGLSVKTASAAGSRLSKDLDVVAHIKKRRDAEFPKDGAKPVHWPFGMAPDEPAEAAAPPPQPEPKLITAEDFLRDVVNDIELDVKVRLDAAKKLIEFEKAKPAPKGKKESQADDAKKMSRFAAGAPPKLVVAGGKKV
jgi:phage terminase small subunit